MAKISSQPGDEQLKKATKIDFASSDQFNGVVSESANVQYTDEIYTNGNNQQPEEVYLSSSNEAE